MPLSPGTFLGRDALYVIRRAPSPRSVSSPVPFVPTMPSVLAVPQYMALHDDHTQLLVFKEHAHARSVAEAVDAHHAATGTLPGRREQRGACLVLREPIPDPRRDNATLEAVEVAPVSRSDLVATAVAAHVALAIVFEVGRVRDPQRPETVYVNLENKRTYHASPTPKQARRHLAASMGSASARDSRPPLVSRLSLVYIVLFLVVLFVVNV